MAKQEHLEILERGVDVWNKWRDKNPHLQPDLIGANLIRANLSKANLFGAYLRGTYLRGADLSRANLCSAYLGGANLFGANLSEADLSGAYLFRANLFGADLSRANLNKADLSGVYLGGANLSRTNLSNADLSEANLSGAYLYRANLHHATISRTTLGDVDLSQVKGLETLVHFGPPIIGIDTLYKSGGKIPETFLKKAGIPQRLIDSLPSFVGNPWEFYSCFISYSNKDHSFANRLYTELQNNGVRCWLATEELELGNCFRQVIDPATQTYDKLLLILSENSIYNKSVEDEVESAFEKERKRHETVLFPIRLDDMVLDVDIPWAMATRQTRHIGDFTRWQDPGEYKKAIERLINDLNTAPNNYPAHS